MGRLQGRAAKLLLVRRKSPCNKGLLQLALQLTRLLRLETGILKQPFVRQVMFVTYI
jgi:hypothetical protein